jgi:hypothetical protein
MHFLYILQALPPVLQELHQFLRYAITSLKYWVIDWQVWTLSDAVVHTTLFYASKLVSKGSITSSAMSTIASKVEAAWSRMSAVYARASRLTRLQGNVSAIGGALGYCTLAVDFWALIESHRGTHRSRVALAMCKQFRKFIGKYVLPVPSMLSIALRVGGLCRFGFDTRSVYWPRSLRSQMV